MGYFVLEDWQAREILLYLYHRYKSIRKLAELLHVSKITLHRCLQEKQNILALLRARLCKVLSEDELHHLPKRKEILRRYGLADNVGSLNKALLLALIDSPMQVETMKEEMLNYLLEYYKKGCRRSLLKSCHGLNGV